MTQFLTRAELADRYRTTVNTLQHWQRIGYGPRSIKIGTRRLYPLDEVERFEAEQLAADNEQKATR